MFKILRIAAMVLLLVIPATILFAEKQEKGAPAGAQATMIVEPAFTVNPARTAILIMDYENDIVGMMPKGIQEPLLENAAAILKAARQAHVQVIYVVVRFRDGYPEVSPQNQLFSGLKDSGRLREGTQGAEVAAKVAPQAGDVIVTKRRVGAFSATDLETILRAKNINTLALFGISTSGVVLSTVRWAADMDYRIMVVSDACADRDPEVQRVLMDKVFPWQATVVDTQEFLKALSVTQGK